MEENMKSLEKETKEVKQPATVAEQYIQTILQRVDAAQKTGDIPSSFVYAHNDKTWLMTLPHSVMAQKRLVHARDTYLKTQSYEDEEVLLKLIAENTRCNNQPFRLDALEYGEVEVMKTAYMDGLLLPLSQGADKSLSDFMTAAVANL